MAKRIVAVTIAAILIIVFITIGFTGCREADKVNHNMSLAADNFNCERRNNRHRSLPRPCHGETWNRRSALRGSQRPDGRRNKRAKNR